MAEHLKTAEYTAEEAKERLAAFGVELAELVQRYELHHAYFSVSISVAAPENLSTAIGETNVYGCWDHLVSFVARSVASILPQDRVPDFFRELQSNLLARAFGYATHPPTQAEAEAVVTKSNLLNMPVPGKKAN